jgi:hypothetical protein
MARKTAAYRWEATTLGGSIQQLAVCYVRNRYHFYVMGCVREGKDPRTIDEKIITKYHINISKAERHRRKLAWNANLQYLRFGRTYLILATHGLGRFFEDEGKAIKDVRRVSIKLGDYAVNFAGDKVRVRIEEEQFKNIKAYFTDVAVKRPSSELAEQFWTLPYEPYAPVRFQLFEILRLVNRLRKASGLGSVPQTAIRKKRRSYRPFDPDERDNAVPDWLTPPLRTEPFQSVVRPSDVSFPPPGPQSTELR